MGSAAAQRALAAPEYEQQNGEGVTGRGWVERGEEGGRDACNVRDNSA